MIRPLRWTLVALLVFVCACSPAPSGTGPTPGTSETSTEALNRGLELHRQGKLYEATVAYFQALSKEPANKFAFYNLGLISQTTKNPAVAESYYRIAISIDANFAQPLYNLAILREEAGDHNEAIALYKRVTAIEPKNANAHYNLGLALRAAGRQSEADAELAQARQLDPKLVAPSTGATPRPSSSP